ncbi:hypothetical protein GGX14DRAFT_541733 [Mycena pura]|uniref:Fungal-type protein kinase domain-containing protein n=1 Tax=Mycena pura TaxID=153505 RepID=A0AAD6YIU1_9AGAR|nr:hypothetical protein GGX14DRAFT_541733 [Mycena pura]
MDSAAYHRRQTTSVQRAEPRSSARIKAAKQKAKEKADDSEKSKYSYGTTTASTGPAKRHEIFDHPSAETHLPVQPALTISEPVRDPKGKKRALPEPNSDEESAGPSTKRATLYSLRSGTDSGNMPRNSRARKMDDPNASGNEGDGHHDEDYDGVDADRESGMPGGAQIPGGLNVSSSVSSPPLLSALSPTFISRPRTRMLAALEPVTTELDCAAMYEAHQKLARDSTQTSSAQTDSILAVAHVEARLAEEIHAHWSKRVDLVESLFGSLVDINSAADIVHEFLATSILSVQKETNGESMDVTGKDHETACAGAAIQAYETVAPSEPSPTDPYRWKWALPAGAPETAPALFLNVVAIAAHAAAIRLGKVQDHSLPSLRFVTLPDPQRAVPLSTESAAQNWCPDVVAFDCSAFCEAPNLDAPANLFFLLEDSPFRYIRKKFPAILNFTPLHRSAHGPAIIAFEEWFAEQERRNYLDMSRFCWPEVQLTVDTKFSDLYHAILQEFVYMRQQRRTQPWMKFIVGLIFTKTFIGVLRADSLGLEQCIFERNSSRGVLDSVRICLGLVQTTSLQRGQHEAFELSDVKTLGPPHLVSKSDGPSKTRFDGPSETTKAEDLVEYTHRTARIIRLRGDRIHHSPDDTKPNVVYYVHYLVQDNGSLVGRGSRIFCVSRQTKHEDGVSLFVGPYALKVYYADHASDCFKDDLIAVSRTANVKNVLLPTWEWHYGDALSMRGFPKAAGAQANPIVPNVMSNREEVFAQTDLKRLLVQCSDFEEFAQAFIDYAEGIASLAEQGLVHRDFSIGNVLLSQDTKAPDTFFSEAADCAESILGVSVRFEQRELELRKGGVIHDMDMSGHLRPVPEAPIGDDDSSDDDDDSDFEGWVKAKQGEREAQIGSIGPQKGFRTGTLPFMAIRLLRHGPPHVVSDDLHSLLFVMALFFWSHDKFSEIPFPQPVLSGNKPWPPEVLQWANLHIHPSLQLLGYIKFAFFSTQKELRASFRSSLQGSDWIKNKEFLRFFWGLYKALWRKVPELGWFDRRDVTPEEVQDALTNTYRISRYGGTDGRSGTGPNQENETHGPLIAKRQSKKKKKL